MEEGSTTVLTVPTDVTDEAQIEVLFERAMEAFNRLDILVNNSGTFDGGPLDELSTEALDNVLSVNLRAPLPVHACSDADHEAARWGTHHQHWEYIRAAGSTGSGTLLCQQIWYLGFDSGDSPRGASARNRRELSAPGGYAGQGCAR